MKVVYVAGPFRDSNHWEIAENIRRAERVALEVWKRGFAAMCPHANTAHFQGAASDSVWLKGDLELLLRCDAVVVVTSCGDWQRSAGTIDEVAYARSIHIPVFYEDKIAELWAALPHLPPARVIRPYYVRLPDAPIVSGSFKVGLTMDEVVENVSRFTHAMNHPHICSSPRCRYPNEPCAGSPPPVSLGEERATRQERGPRIEGEDE